MRKILVVIMIILVFIFLCILNIVKNGNDDTSKVFNNIENSLLNLIKYDKINDISYYYGTKTYLVVNYEYNDSLYYAIVSEEEKLINNIKEDKLYDKKKIGKLFKDYDYVINLGYEDDFIYEVKVFKNNIYTYYYYDAKKGNIIKEIDIKK